MILDKGTIKLLKSDIEDIVCDYLYENANKITITEVFDEITQILYKYNLYNDEQCDFRPIIPNINVTFDYTINENDSVFEIDLIDYDTKIEITA